MAQEESQAKVYACPDCDKTFTAPGGLIFHRIAVHGYRKPGGSSKASRSRRPAARGAAPKTEPAGGGGGGGTPPAGVTDREIAQEVDDAVGNLRGLGVLLYAAGPQYTGLTLAGVEVEAGTPGAVEDPKDSGHWWVVRSRAVMAQPFVLDQARRDLRIFLAIRWFNKLFKMEAVAEAGAGLAAGVALDAGVPVEFGFRLGRLKAQPIPALLSDVLQYQQLMAAGPEGTVPPVGVQNGQQAPPGPPADQPPPVVEVQGGVEAT